jgi:NAD(P)-dependent dehydrogenase (short-subunit alcohol dehydrogenase family)
MKRLDGKVAIITGCTRGIGKDAAELFADEGATVVATSRSIEPGALDGIDCRRLDVASERQWIETVAAVVNEYGHVDVLVNNAGVIAYEALHELSTDDWNDVVATNQTGVWIGMREVIPHMIAQGGGSIINVSSIWGTVAVSGAHAYHATKGAVRTMSKSAAITYATDNIRVNSVHPGFIHTPLTDAQAPEINKYVVSQTPMGRAGEPREVANCILFLASDESSFVTGSELVVDGGYLAQ